MPSRFAIACGGTGGHMFPGLAVASELARRGHAVAVVLSGRKVESERAADSLPEGAVPMLVPVDPVSARRPLSLLKLARAVFRARGLLRRFKPDALLAMGSYTSLAPVLAARMLRIPVVLHEANAIPGSAIARLARYADAVCVCFPRMERFFPKRVRIVDTGLPIRAEFQRGSAGTKADPSRFSLLVMGGSQGARDLNRDVVDSVSAWNPGEGVPPLRIVHLAGTRNEEEVRGLYAAADLDPASVEVEVVGFEHDMARRYAEADLCISRAGASSCFELALVGLPAAFVPLRGLANDHQVRNAESMEQRGAGWCVASRDAIAVVRQAVLQPEKRVAMREAMLSLARPDAAARVADVLEQTGAP